MTERGRGARTGSRKQRKLFKKVFMAYYSREQIGI